MKEVLEVIIKNLVNNKDAVEIKEVENEKSIVFEVKVADEDFGKVIGKQGKIAQSIRTVMKAVAGKKDKKVNGIKGEIKVTLFTNDITRFDDLEEVYVKSKKESKLYKVEGVRYHKNMVLIKLEGINTPEQADLLKNAYLEVDREHAVPLEEGTYYIVDLIGLEVYTEEGKLLGKVEDIYNTGANDIYVIKDELGKQVLLPGIKDVIKNVDLEGGKITVHLIPGLI